MALFVWRSIRVVIFVFFFFLFFEKDHEVVSYLFLGVLSCSANLPTPIRFSNSICFLPSNLC